MKQVFVMIVAAFALVNVAGAHGCREGETQYFPSNNPSLVGGETGARDVLWTCQGGRFRENGYSAPASGGAISCRDGESYYWPSNNPSLKNGEGGSQDVLWICKNGGFYEQGYSAPAQRGLRACREGSHEIFWESADGNYETHQPVEYVCRHGRFLKVIR